MKCRNKCVDHLGVVMHAVAGNLCSVCFTKEGKEGIPEEGIFDAEDTKGLNKYYAEMLIPIHKLRKESNFRLARLKALVNAIEISDCVTNVRKPDILAYITALCSPKQLWDIKTFAQLIQNLYCTTDDIIGVMKYFGKQFQDDSEASDTFQCLAANRILDRFRLAEIYNESPESRRYISSVAICYYTKMNTSDLSVEISRLSSQPIDCFHGRSTTEQLIPFGAYFGLAKDAIIYAQLIFRFRLHWCKDVRNLILKFLKPVHWRNAGLANSVDRRELLAKAFKYI